MIKYHRRTCTWINIYIQILFTLFKKVCMSIIINNNCSLLNTTNTNCCCLYSQRFLFYFHYTWSESYNVVIESLSSVLSTILRKLDTEFWLSQIFLPSKSNLAVNMRLSCFKIDIFLSAFAICWHMCLTFLLSILLVFTFTLKTLEKMEVIP